MSVSVPVELEVQRKGKKEATLHRRGDPKDTSWAQEQLHNWLRSERWAESRWGEFEVVTREEGAWSVKSRVPA